MKIWTDDECIEVDPNDVGELEAAMRFKAEHIKAKADPELFTTVADALKDLFNTATRRVEVVRCLECKYHHDCETHFCDALGMDCPDDSEFFCSYGEKKEGADNEP